MTVAGLIFVVVVVSLLIYGVLTYNRFVNLKHGVGKAWSNIDVLLKQRHDELPKLVETCRQYMKFEQETLEKVMQARAGVAQAREHQDISALEQPKGFCAPAWEICLLWPRLTRNSKPTKPSFTCRLASPVWKTPLQTDASFITKPST